MENATNPRRVLRKQMPNKSQIQPIIGATDLKSWNILDSSEDFALVHYQDTANMDQWGHLRGVIVDLKHNEIVCQTYGHMPEFEHSEVPISKDGTTIELVGVEGGNVSVPYMEKSNENVGDDNSVKSGGGGNETTQQAPLVKINPGHEGALINIWKDRYGEFHMSSMKKINYYNSKWGDSLPYGEIYEELEGPDPESFFEPGKLSPFVHTIILAHPDLYNVTKEVVLNMNVISNSKEVKLVTSNQIESVGYLVYLGAKKMNVNLGEDNVEAAPKSIATVGSIKQARKEKKLYAPVAIDIEIANKHLRYGHYHPWKDENVSPYHRNGEFLIINDKYRVLSPAYYWRARMRAHNHILCNMFRLASRVKDTKYFDNGFFPHLHEQDLNKLGNAISKGNPINKYFKDRPLLDLSDYRNRLINIWLCYILAVPIHRQQDVFNCLSEYEALLTKGANMALEIYSSNEEYRNVDQVFKIVEIAKRLSAKNGRYREKGKSKYSSESRDKYNIKNILRNMNGKYSYSLIRHMEKEKMRLASVKRKEALTKTEAKTEAKEAKIEDKVKNIE